MIEGSVDGRPVEIPAVPEATDAHLKFRVRPSTRSKFDEFKTEFSAALGGVRLMDSNVGWAIIDWFMEESAPAVLRHLEAAPRCLQRPPSDDPVAMSEFDIQIRRIMSQAVQEELDR